MSAPAGLELPRRRTRYKRRRWPWIVGFLLLLALLLLADAAWSGVQAAQALQDTKDELQAGASALENGDVPTAQNDFGAASSHATAAVNALAHPGPQVLAHVPWLGHNVDAVQRLSRAAQLSAQAGSALTNAADAAGWSGDNLPGFSAGHLDPSVIEKAAPGLAEAALLMAEASQEVDPVDPSSLLGPLRDPATQVKDEVTTKAALAGKLAQAAAVLPQMLGADGPRTYLVVSLNTSDPRGSSGYAGAYSVMRVQDGTFSLTKFKPTGTIPRVPPVAAPEEVVKRWKDSGSLSSFIDTTYPPDFPTAGMLMTEIWQAAGRPPVDGVLAADPHFMAELLQRARPGRHARVARDDHRRQRGADPRPRTRSRPPPPPCRTGGRTRWATRSGRPS